MSIIERNLMAGERVVYRGRLHWRIFAKPVLFLVAAIAAFSLAAKQNIQYLPYVGWVLLAVGLAMTISSMITWYSSEFVVTNKRIVAKVGVIHSHSLELLLSKVEAITVDQDLIGRLLGFGTIGLTGTGGTLERFPSIASPWEFRTKTQEQISAVQDKDRER